MPQTAAAPASNYEYDHLEARPRADAEQQRPVGAEPDVEERFVALQRSIEGHEVYIQDLRQRMADSETYFKDDHDWLARLAHRVLNLEHPPKKPGYVFKLDQELLWAFFVGAVGVVAAAAADLDTITDWRAWALGLVVGLARFTVGFLQSRAKKEPSPPAQ